MESEEFYCRDLEGEEMEVIRTKIESVTIEGFKIIAATRDEATYKVEFSTQILADLEYEDYDNSPWDSETHEYVYVVRHSFSRMHNERYTCIVTIDFSDGLPANADIYDVEFEYPGFDLNELMAKL